MTKLVWIQKGKKHKHLVGTIKKTARILNYNPKNRKETTRR